MQEDEPVIQKKVPNSPGQIPFETQVRDLLSNVSYPLQHRRAGDPALQGLSAALFRQSSCSDIDQLTSSAQDWWHIQTQSLGASRLWPAQRPSQDCNPCVIEDEIHAPVEAAPKQLCESRSLLPKRLRLLWVLWKTFVQNQAGGCLPSTARVTGALSQGDMCLSPQ